LAADLWVNLDGAAPWTVANQFGDGHAVPIGGRVSADTILEDCPDHARWI
jgi:hypothetical protein